MPAAPRRTLSAISTPPARSSVSRPILRGPPSRPIASSSAKPHGPLHPLVVQSAASPPAGHPTVLRRARQTIAGRMRHRVEDAYVVCLGDVDSHVSVSVGHERFLWARTSLACLWRRASAPANQPHPGIRCAPPGAGPRRVWQAAPGYPTRRPPWHGGAIPAYLGVSACWCVRATYS